MRTRFISSLLATVTVAAGLLALPLAGGTGPLAGGIAHADVTGSGGDFVRLTASALLADTRVGTGVPKAAMTAGSTLAVPALGHGGVPSTGVSAVLVNLQAFAPTSTTWLGMYPDGTSFGRDTSNLNIPAGMTSLSNSATVQVGTDGKIAIYNSAGTVNVVVIVEGYYTTSSAGTGPGGFTPVYYNRVLDTRNGTGAPKAQIAAGAAVSFTVTGGAVPANADSVYLDLVVTNQTKTGWLTEYPYGGAVSGYGVVDFGTDTTSHEVAVKPSGGKITVVNRSSAPIDLIADQEGYTSSDNTIGAGFHPARQRILGATALAANGTLTIPIVGRPGLPTQHINGVQVSLGVYGSTVNGYLRAWGTGNTEPAVGALNFTAGVTRAGLASVAVTGTGSITVHNTATSSIDLLVDLVGYFSTEHRSAAPVQFAPTTALQLPASGTGPGALEYSYVDNVGRLLVGYQASIDDFSSVSWSVQSTIGDVLTGMPSLTVQSDKSVLLSAEYSDTGIDTKTLAYGGTTWSAFANTGGSFSAAPAVGTMPTGGIYSFAVDDAGALWVRAAGSTTTWVSRSTSPALVGTPTVVTTGSGIQVFAVTTAGTVVTALYQGGASLGPWTDLGGTGVTDRPAVAVRPGYLMQVVIRQGDGSIATKAQAANGSYPASWAAVDTFTAIGAPATVFDPVTGQIEILARDPQGYIWNSGETVQGSQTWRTWQQLPAEASATDPTITTFTGSSNGDGWVAPYRTFQNGTRVITRTYPGGAAAAAAHPSYQVNALAPAPAG